MLSSLRKYLKNQNTLFSKILYRPARKIYHYSKEKIYQNALLSFILDKYTNNKNRDLENKSLKAISQKGYQVLEMKDVYSRFTEFKNKTCHIIGGGWSLNDSLKKINSDDFVISMNYTALANTHINAYFIEQGLSNEQETRLRIKIIDEIVSKQTSNVFYKNAFGPHDSEYIADNYGDKVIFIKSFLVECMNPKNLYKTMEYFLAYDPVYFRQYMSTLISSVAFAKNIGIKNIVLHGLDFGGSYFYESNDFPESKQKYIPPKSSLSRGKKVHQTVSQTCGIDKALPYIKEILTKQKVNLYAGSIHSPSAKLLDVFN